MKYLATLTAMCLLLPTVVFSLADSSTILLTQMNYAGHQSPNTSGPAQISHTIELVHLHEIDEKKEHVTLILKEQMSWME